MENAVPVISESSAPSNEIVLSSEPQSNAVDQVSGGSDLASEAKPGESTSEVISVEIPEQVKEIVSETQELIQAAISEVQSSTPEVSVVE